MPEQVRELGVEQVKIRNSFALLESMGQEISSSDVAAVWETLGCPAALAKTQGLVEVKMTKTPPFTALLHDLRCTARRVPRPSLPERRGRTGKQLCKTKSFIETGSFLRVLI